MFRFRGKTAYVAVTYFDRFLAQREVDVIMALSFRLCLTLLSCSRVFDVMTASALPFCLDCFQRGKEWALQLLAVACLSLAAKLEEYRSPRLSEFPVEAREIQCATILRMELLVLATLRWHMITVTPFAFISCFAARFRQDECRAIILRAVECVFDSIKG